MAIKNIQTKPLKGAPLCKKHFIDYTLDIIKSKSEPTRIQPRRAAKDKVLEQKANTKKRRADEDISSSSKRKKTNDLAKWEAFGNLLEERVIEIAEEAREKGPHNCAFGPAPWACHMCPSDFEKLVNEKVCMAKPVAPVADMATVGEIFELNYRKDFEKGVMTKFKWEGIPYVIDACRTPMLMVL
ncbi:uncharacterized protein FIESC28_00616 [Fusarium coffeatum]|uniref:Uncharacterized protein n=1 Tax=Fusarium coffeatum TaxID=231269 RepID=A0A366SBE3_9HYPO|nr:uncharacterized protein FIESC28_00616 [Fusarium coffeatum]RBR26619.1 hypothetical protein FIESC28_00616 [Fusarium coffeatum]